MSLSEEANAMNLLREVQAVLWSFIGLGRRGDMDALHRTGRPAVLVVVGLILAALLVAMLIALATLAVRLLS